MQSGGRLPVQVSDAMYTSYSPCSASRWACVSAGQPGGSDSMFVSASKVAVAIAASGEPPS